MSGEHTISEWSIPGYANQEDGDQNADTTNISWRLKQDRQSRKRKEKLRCDLVRERYERKSRESAPSPSLLRKFLRRS